MKDYMTLLEIEQEAWKRTPMYDRVTTRSRAVGLLKFIRDLEQKYGDEFKIVTAHPRISHILHTRGYEPAEYEPTPLFTLGNWVHFKIGEMHTYVEFNENVFFDTHMTQSHVVIDNNYTEPSKVICDYATRMNDIIHAGLKFNDNIAEESEKMRQNLHVAFEKCCSEPTQRYTRKIGASEKGYKKTGFQELYFEVPLNNEIVNNEETDV